MQLNKSNVIYIRIDRNPDIKKEIQIMKAELGLKNYIDLLELFVKAYKDNPHYFKSLVATTKFKFIG